MLFESVATEQAARSVRPYESKCVTRTYHILPPSFLHHIQVGLVATNQGTTQEDSLGCFVLIVVDVIHIGSLGKSLLPLTPTTRMYSAVVVVAAAFQQQQQHWRREKEEEETKPCEGPNESLSSHREARRAVSRELSKHHHPKAKSHTPLFIYCATTATIAFCCYCTRSGNQQRILDQFKSDAQ